jgi:hypothetical protein
MITVSTTDNRNVTNPQCLREAAMKNTMSTREVQSVREITPRVAISEATLSALFLKPNRLHLLRHQYAVGKTMTAVTKEEDVGVFEIKKFVKSPRAVDLVFANNETMGAGIREVDSPHS